MKSRLVLLLLVAGTAARADFSYTMTQKTGPAGGTVTKSSLKGQKMKDDHGNTVTIMDFETETMTTIDNTAKTYKVMKFSDLMAPMADMDVQSDVKNTGQTKTINGFNASQVIMTMNVDMPAAQQRPGIKSQLEMEIWLTRDVPGSQEMAAFYKKNAAHWPFASSGNSNSSMQKASSNLLQQIGEFNGVPVLLIYHLKTAGMSDAQTQQMAQARAQLEALAKQGGPGATAAQQALAKMGGMGAGGSLLEMTMEASDFSAAAIPASAFDIPAGYRQVDQ